jgi:hypothetical protein
MKFDKKNEQRTDNKNYISIAVSALTTSCIACNSSGTARQENRPQSATFYTATVSLHFKKTKKR